MATKRLQAKLEAEKLKKQKELEKLIEKPFIKFNGKIEYYTTFIDCAEVCDKLLKDVNNSTDEVFPIGFDLEWRFTFQTGPEKTALMQICANYETVYLLHIINLKSLPTSLNLLLSHDKVRIVGVNIKNDVRKLGRDFKGLSIEKIIENCVDSGSQANRVLPITQRWSMEKLVNYLYQMELDKNKKIRHSKWNVVPLSDEQKLYAATDAYVSLKLYNDLIKTENDNILLNEKN